MLLVNPNDCVSFRHHHLPEDIFCVLVWLEKSVFWNISFLIRSFPLNKLSNAHPHIINMPTSEYSSKIFSKEHSDKSFLLVNNIYPETLVSISHDLKCLPQRSVFFHLNIFSFGSLKKGVNIYGAVIAELRLVCNSEDVKKNILKIED